MSIRVTVVQPLVSAFERVLRRFPWLYRIASRTLYKFDTSFYTLSEGLPQAIESAMQRLKSEGVLDRGDYFEFGVFRGFALSHAQKFAAQLGADEMHFYGFDSFQGLPRVQAEEAVGSMFFEGQFACSKTFVENALRHSGNELSRITLVKGYFDASLTDELKAGLPRRRANIAVVDCDLYTSTVPVLRWLDDLLAPGSIVLMDDWRSFGEDSGKGQQRAFKEWGSERPGQVAEPMFDFHPHGRAFRIAAKALGFVLCFDLGQFTELAVPSAIAA